MNPTENYIKINKALWNDKVAHHVSSDFYNMEAFIAGKTSLNPVELALLGDVSGKRILHLQCHFGQDTLSLARMGAEVTGVDFSDIAIAYARKLAEAHSLAATFICCDLYELPQHLSEPFDIVFTSYGTIGWLPDLDKWAAIVNRFLKPEGKFIFVEFHPVIWMLDEDFQQIKYRYFKDEPIVETTVGTYADREAPIEHQSVSWNFSLSEMMTALLKQDLNIRHFEELDYSPYPCFKEVEEVEPGKFRIRHLGNKIPMLFSLVATKA
ncbi:MAG: class I SAM-dependent methyltransferase [Sphingobacteriales bacterium]|nr:MAG: class I SAM-dependent methyltransferase [Sphingobacteriales bacterium]